jgi:cell division protein FtsI (penicillin-binding protein 3)
MMMEWPIFREGRLRGGAIFEKIDVRYHPFANLSRRTIGFINENDKGAGLEYSFNDQLGGRWLCVLSKNCRRPLEANF